MDIPRDLPVLIFEVMDHGRKIVPRATDELKERKWELGLPRCLLLVEGTEVNGEPQYVRFVALFGECMHFALHNGRYGCEHHCCRGWKECRAVYPDPTAPFHDVLGGEKIINGRITGGSQDFGPFHNEWMYELVARALGINCHEQHSERRKERAYESQRGDGV